MIESQAKEKLILMKCIKSLKGKLISSEKNNENIESLDLIPNQSPHAQYKLK
jgi:hypothetical protein